MPKNSITKRDDGRYYYRSSTPSGKRIGIYSKKGELLKDFKRRCDSIDALAPSGDHKDTMDELFNLWIDLHVKPNLSASTLRVYVPIYESHVQPHIGKMKINEITRTDVYKVLSIANEQGYSAKTIKHIRSCISAPFNFAVNTLGYPISVPTQGLRFAPKKRSRSKIRIISPTDLERILRASEGSKYHNYFKLLSLTGLRPSEALGLQIRDITSTHIKIRRGVTIDGISDLKTTAACREIPLIPELKEIIVHQKKNIAFKTPEGWLFPSEIGVPSMNSVRLGLQRTLKQTAVHKYGGRNGMHKISLITPPVKCSLYDFRHTFATRMAESGMELLALKNIMGHEDVSVTMKYYVDYTKQMEENAMKIMSESMNRKISD